MEDKKIDVVHENEGHMDRRNFLKVAGKTAAGVVVAGSALSMLSGCDQAEKYTYHEKEELAYEYVEVASNEVPALPYKYQKLDPATCAERAYAAYQQQGG